MDVTGVCGSLGHWSITQHGRHSAVYPAPRECSVNGNPVGGFSKERQAIGKGLGRLLEKMDSELDFGAW